jgi:hypothetical protein
MDPKERNKLADTATAPDAEMQPFSFEQNLPGPVFWLIKVSTWAAVVFEHPERILDLA